MSRRLFWPVTATSLIVLGLLLDRFIPSWPWSEITLPGTHRLMRVDPDGQRFHTAFVETARAHHFPSLPFQIWKSNDCSLDFRLGGKDGNDWIEILGNFLLAHAEDGLHIVDLNTRRDKPIPAADPTSRFECFPKQQHFPWVYGSLPDGKGWNLAWLHLRTGEVHRCPGRQVEHMASQTRCLFTSDTVIVADHSAEKHVGAVEI